MNLRFSASCGALFIISRLLDPYVKATICAVTMQKMVFLNIIFFCPFLKFRNNFTFQQNLNLSDFFRFFFYNEINIDFEITSRKHKRNLIKSNGVHNLVGSINLFHYVNYVHVALEHIPNPIVVSLFMNICSLY